MYDFVFSLIINFILNFYDLTNYKLFINDLFQIHNLLFYYSLGCCIMGNAHWQWYVIRVISFKLDLVICCSRVEQWLQWI